MADPPLAPTKLPHGKAHSLAFRERIAIAIEAGRTAEPRRRAYEVADMFAVDRKTARQYYQWWKQDRANGVDYSKAEDLKKSLLNPLTWKELVSEGGGKKWAVKSHDWLNKRFRNIPTDEAREVWTKLSEHLADLQINHVPQYTAADIVAVTGRVIPRARVNPVPHQPVLHLRSAGYGPDLIEPAKDAQEHLMQAPVTRRAVALRNASAGPAGPSNAVVAASGAGLSNAAAGPSNAVVVASGAGPVVPRRQPRQPGINHVDLYPFMKDSVREKFVELQKFMTEKRVIHLTEADVERARKEHKLSYKTIAYDYQEKDLKTVVREKQVFRKLQATLYAEDCVFIDEFHVVMNLAPQKGWTKPGTHAPLRRHEQRYSKTTVLAAMRWPSNERAPHAPRVAFYLRILPPLPGRITNQNPCNTAPEREIADVLRGQPWWEGLMMLMGGYVHLYDGVPFHEISLFRVKSRLVPAKAPRGGGPTPLSSRADIRDVILEGVYDVVFPDAVNERAVSSQPGFLPEVHTLWTKDGRMNVNAVSKKSMRDTFWSFLPGRVADGTTHDTIADFLGSIPTLSTPDAKVEFVVRLAAHDFVMIEYIRRHNYPIKPVVYGDDIEDLNRREDFKKSLPPGITFKNVTPLLRAGNDDIKVRDVLKETEEEARRNMLAYPEKGLVDKSHDEDDERSGSQLMVDKLVEVYKNSSYKEILNSLFFDETSPEHRQLDAFLSSDADSSLMFDREYVNQKSRAGAREQAASRTVLLARAIYRALSVQWTVQGKSSSMTPLDVAAHVWFIVHHCAGNEKWMDGKLEEMNGHPFKYGSPPRDDPDFRGALLVKDLLKNFSTFTTVQRDRVLPIVIARRHFSDKHAGAPPLPVTKTVFKWFLESIPDGFVEGKTIIMDGAPVHGKPINAQRQRNDELKEKRIYPDGEMSEFALMLRKRGAGDALLQPPTEETIDKRKIALMFLPPFSPEFNPIELAFNTAKKFIWREAARVGRTRLNLSYVIINAFHALIRPHAIKNYMLCSGYRTVEKNVVPVAPSKDEEKDAIVDVLAYSAPDVLLPVRRGCQAQFVDGKYEDPSKPKKAKDSEGRPTTYRDYTRRAEIAHEYPGKDKRKHLDFRIPRTTTCRTERNAKEGFLREVGTECRRKAASEYRVRDEVEVRLKGRDDWVDAVVTSVPPAGNVHNPWIGVDVPNMPSTQYVPVARVRDRRDVRVLAAARAKQVMKDSEAVRREMVRERKEDKDSKGAEAAELRRDLWNTTDERRDKYLLEFVRGSADPLKMLTAQDRVLDRVKPLTEKEMAELPEAYTRLLVP